MANTGLSLGLRLGSRRKLSLVLQSEAAECGLACLAMIASFHGYEIDLLGLRRRASMSLKGTDLGRMIDIAGQLQMSARPLRLELEELPQLQVPCILHWDMNHFVVLKFADTKGIVVHDPAQGVKRYSISEASEHFTGVALELEPMPSFQPQKAKQKISLRALAGNIRGLKRGIIHIALLALSLEVFVLLSPFFMQWVLDNVLVSADRGLMTLLGIGFLMLTIFQVAIAALRSWSITWLGAQLNVQWVANLFGHMMRLPLEYFEKRHVGDVQSRFGSIQTIQRTLTTQFVSAFLDGVMSLAILALMIAYSPKLTLVVITAFGLYSLLRWSIFGPLKRSTEEQIVYTARQQSDLLESIRGIQTLKLANQQEIRRSRFADAAIETSNRDIAVRRLTIAYEAGNGLIFGIHRIVLIWLAALMVLNAEFSAGMLVAFVAYADMFTARAGKFIDQWNEFRMLDVHADRISDIALTPEEPNLYTAYAGTLTNASLEVRGVSFRYAEGEPWVLRDLSLIIEPGECVAITGPSGCGKSTLTRLILGLLEPTEGEILFGGVDIRKLGLAHYREMIGAVLQDDQLFTGSIANNISYVNPAASLKDIEEASRKAHIHDEIVFMPMGYESFVGDMGSSLSGGQKQRVLLARALYRQPRLLVLDEATSHLDVERERQVNDTISQLNLTRVVIAHRPETIAMADREIHLGGQGTHTAALLAKLTAKNN